MRLEVDTEQAGLLSSEAGWLDPRYVPSFVVVASPIPDGSASVVKAAEPVHVQAPVAHEAGE